MKIMVFEGSPNKRGSSNLLTTEFIHGAKAAGHLVQTVDAKHMQKFIPVLAVYIVGMKALVYRKMK